MATPTADNQKRIDFMYEVMQKKSDYINTSFNTQTTKINYLFGFTSASIVLYIQLLLRDGYLCDSPLIVFGKLFGMLGLILTLFCLCIATKTRTFFDTPHEDIVYSDEAFQQSSYDLKSQVVADIKSGYKKNTSSMQDISKWLDISVRLLFISICTIILSALS